MAGSKILIVEDNTLVSQAVCDMLRESGYEAETVETGREAKKLVKTGQFKVILLDMMLPDTSGDKLLKEWSKLADLNIVIVTAYGEVSTAIECLRLGASDFLVKPVEKVQLLQAVKSAFGDAFEETNEEPIPSPPTPKEKTSTTPKPQKVKKPGKTPGNLIYTSDSMRKTVEIGALVAQSDFSCILITGESGAGKGMLSNAIHTLGKRAQKPFVEINCSALPATLIESELFGHKKGAFTDAKEDKVGLFEMADGGILFLDEIGDMDVKLQTKMLKAIEDRSFRRVGDTQNRKVDIAIIAATNADLMQLVREGKFRLDLYHRLNVIPIHIDPLRKRKDDIPLLRDFFLEHFNKKFKRNIKGFNKEAAEILLDYSWPGNVRELANVVERSCILTRKDIIGTDFLFLREPEGSDDELLTLAEAERQAIRKALDSAEGQLRKASSFLGIPLGQLQQKIQEHAL